jgi:hypothetical protein
MRSVLSLSVRARSSFLLACALPFAACLSCTSASDAPAESGDGGGLCSGWPEPGVAFTSNFTGFHAWSNAAAVGPDGSTDGLHGVGPLRVYWNAAPPHGATEFPQCTIIVKETEETDVTQRIVFAMVKRGAGYNTSGANGWEWWSLQNNADGTVSELWNGTIAPGGETYANQPIGDCNGCHAMVSKNDSVWDTALQLSNF